MIVARTLIDAVSTFIEKAQYNFIKSKYPIQSDIQQAKLQ